MNKKEVKGIGGFLLIFIILYIIETLFQLIGVKFFHDIAIYYMPWKENSINFLCAFSILMCLISFINIIMLLFVREKFVISFTINLYIFMLISGVIIYIMFNDLIYVRSFVQVFSFLFSIFYTFCCIIYLKKSKRVKNTYCGKENINTSDYRSNTSKTNNHETDKQYYYSNWQQFSNGQSDNFNSHHNTNYDDKYNRSNWEKFSKDDIPHDTNTHQSNTNGSYQRSNHYEQKKENNSYQQSNNSEQKKSSSYKESYENKLPNDVVKAFKVFDMPITTSSFEAVKKKYHLLIKIYHPDKNNGDAETARYAEQKTKEINMAYSVLRNYFSQKC